MKRLIFILTVLLFSTACFAQKNKWKKAQKINTIESYQEFVRNYPSSQFIGDAKQSLIELEFEKALKKNTVEGYNYFLRNYGENKYTEVIKNSLMILDFDNACKKNTVSVYQEFIEKYPNSDTYSEAAQNRISDKIYSEFKNARASNNVNNLERFIKSYPDSKYADEARNSIDALKEFEEIKKINSVQAYEAFVKKHPNTASAEEAQKSIVMLKEWNKIEPDLSLDSYFMFYKKHPDAYILLSKQEIEKFIKDACNSEKYISKKVNSITINIAKNIRPGSSVSMPLLSNCNYEVLSDGRKLNTNPPLTRIRSDETTYIIHFYSNAGFPLVFKWTVNEKGNLYTFNHLSGAGYVLFIEGNDVKIWDLN